MPTYRLPTTDYRLFYHLHSHKIFFWLFLLAFAAQIFFWKETQHVKPRFDLVPPAPNQLLTSAASLGDKEFLFRALALRFQNSGDVFAGFTALKDYDYLRIYQWMKALDALDSKSNLVPSLASYYYAQTQKTEDLRYITAYLDEHAASNLDEKWWWLFQAIYIAQKQLKDEDLALDLAYKMSKNNSPKAPLWTKQMPAFLLADRGGKNDGCLAFSIIENLIQENETGARKIDPKEMNFMRHFINQRLKKLKSQNFDPRNCNS